MNSNNQNQDHLQKLRHSAAHLLAAAVKDLYPKALPAIGPAIEDGFYYDFDFGKQTISDKDLKTIQKKMHQLVHTWEGFKRIEVTKAAALKEFKGNPYKKELINEFAGEGKKLTIYQSGNFRDLCRGGHIDNPQSELKHFKLLSLAGAYWRGDEKNKMLTRIYGTAFDSDQALADHLHNLEEAKKRDHRKLGQELDLFTFSDLVGKGLPLFTPKGATIWRELERFVIDEELKAGYQHVKTPNIAKTDLYRKSGHYPYYKDTMYPAMKVDDDELILRPMTCPHHFALYLDRPRSYKELPLRFAEMASLYRYEKSGELTGLIRVRSFTLADSHNFVAKSQAASEVNFVLNLIESIASPLGLKKGDNYLYRLSLGNPQDKKKYYQSPEDWRYGEDLLRQVLKDRQAPFYEAPDEAAFYGPKIDVQMKNVLGKEDTAFTVQYDFCLPQRFKLEFINQEGQPEQPVVIHRSSVGALERTLGFLIEHYAGAFPTWLSPIQAVVIPITDTQEAYARQIGDALIQASIRGQVWTDGSMQKRIRSAEKQKIPYMLVVGDKEQDANTISVRHRGQQDLGTTKLDKLITSITEAIATKSLS